MSMTLEELDAELNLTKEELATLETQEKDSPDIADADLLETQDALASTVEEEQKAPEQSAKQKAVGLLASGYNRSKGGLMSAATEEGKAATKRKKPIAAFSTIGEHKQAVYGE